MPKLVHQPAWHVLEIDEVFNKLESKSSGLSRVQVDSRLSEYGLNQLPEVKSRSYITIFLGQFLNPLIYLLLLAALIAFFVGEGDDSLVILVVVIINAIIGTFQEGKAERSLESLRRLAQLQTKVIRDGIEQSVEASQLVPGDIISLIAGDAVPADARLIEAFQLSAAEGALTGESLPVDKNISPMRPETSLVDRSNMIYAGTYIQSGRCVAVVVATGLQNEIGKISTLASSAVQPKTQLELRIEQFGRHLILAAIFLSLSVVAIGYLHGIPFLEIFMVAISQMVSLVPEGLPVAMTIALAVGVQRMVRRNTVVRRLSAVESLGSTTIICTDKTGTLTKNEMTVTRIYLPFQSKNISVTGIGYIPEGSFLVENKTYLTKEDPVFDQLIKALVLCNDAQLIPPSDSHANWKVLGDPTEGALLTLASKAGFDFKTIRKESLRLAEIPFNSSAKMMATEFQFGGESCVFIKGAPEVVIDYCSSLCSDGEDLVLTQEMRQKINKVSFDMAHSALRVLAFAYVKKAHIKEQSGFQPFYKEAVLIGLVGQMDPPRDEVAQAIRDSQSAGIKVVMITGDHKATGVAIARSLGISQNEDLALDGSELEALTDSSLEKIVDQVSVFARVQPAQKLRIVEALQKKGHVVAMTGDGVNDAPALVQADVGVSMGITGTEVAKEASKVIIADDNFATIVAAVAEGRLVYQNIKKLVLFLFVTSMDEVVVLFLALIFGYPPPLAALQILWINLVTEGTLTVNLVMESPEGDEMKRHPIPKNEPLMDKKMLLRMPSMTISSVVATFGWYFYRSRLGVPMDRVQTETFTMLAICQWFNVLNCRSATQSAFSLSVFKNLWLVGGLLLANILQVAVVYWKPLSQLFHTVAIPPNQFFAIGAVASLVLWVEEIQKFFLRRTQNKSD